MHNAAPTDRRKHFARGSAAVEFGITVPLLFLIAFGATDFGRLFYSGLIVQDAAATGAFLGAQRTVTSVMSSGMEAVADDDTASIDHVGSVSSTADHYCDCPSNPADGPADSAAVDCLDQNACPAYGFPRLFVRTRVEQSFAPIVPLLGIPSTVNISRLAYYRVQ